MYHPALSTSACQTLSTEYPVPQAGMGFVARGELAAAVSGAGGLEILGAAMIPASKLRDEIACTQSKTVKPFADAKRPAESGREYLQNQGPPVATPFRRVDRCGFIATPEAWGNDNFEEAVVEIDDDGTARKRDGEVDIGACAMEQSAAVIQAATPTVDVLLQIMEDATRVLERVSA